VYKNENIAADLKIKTHYESLNIAKSNTIFYLSFTLPETIDENDDRLNEIFLPQSTSEK
jgi:tRNA (guanine-N7-)-methyltransferase